MVPTFVSLRFYITEWHILINAETGQAPGQRNEVLESLYTFVITTVVTFAQQLRQFHKGLSP
jgi:hypothetical protein